MNEVATWLESEDRPALIIAPAGQDCRAAHRDDLDAEIADTEKRIAKLQKLSDLKSEQRKLETQIYELDGFYAVDFIMAKTAAEFGMTTNELTSQNRQRFYVTARCAAWMMLREFTSMSFAAIAQKFNRRDHSTVLYGIATLKGWLPADRALERKIGTLRAQIQAVLKLKVDEK
jgi:chromosomal replication initiation ATPase DnaA